MSSLYTTSDQTLKQFESFQSAVIDTSSIIYLENIDTLNLLSNTITLYTPQSVIDEYSKPINCISIIKNTSTQPTDDQIIQLALLKKIPVISEDFKIIKTFSQTGLPFFNSLMMISFLFFKKVIPTDEYYHYLSLLKQIARYNKYVWMYGEQIFSRIITNQNIVNL